MSMMTSPKKWRKNKHVALKKIRLSFFFTTYVLRFNQLSTGVTFIELVEPKQRGKSFPTIQNICKSVGVSGKLTDFWHRSVLQAIQTGQRTIQTKATHLRLNSYN